MVSYKHLLKDENFLDANGQLVHMKSFKYILRIMCSCARDPTVIGLFVKDSNYLAKLLRMIEEVNQEEIVSNSLKVFRLALTNDKYSDATFSRFPNILNFMIFEMERWIGSSAVLGECVLSVRYTIQEGKNVSLLKPETAGAFMFHIKNNATALRDSNLQELMDIFETHPKYAHFTQGLPDRSGNTRGGNARQVNNVNADDSD